MHHVSPLRLNCLRAMYLFIVVGFGTFLLPGILAPSHPLEPLEAVTNHMLLAFWLLCVPGLLYPLQMLPVLLWEIVWKTVWVLTVALPQWRSGQMAHFTEANLSWIPLLLLCYAVVPWGYVVKQYLRKSPEPWRQAAAS
jgi:hypothetical protein